MIRPEPITVDGRTGVVVFLDEDGIPVAPRDERAGLARAVFDDGGRAVYQVQPKTGSRPPEDRGTSRRDVFGSRSRVHRAPRQ